MSCSNMAGINNSDRYLSTDEEIKIFVGLIHEKNITNFNPNINLQSRKLPVRQLILFPDCNHYFFYIAVVLWYVTYTAIYWPN